MSKKNFQFKKKKVASNNRWNIAITVVTFFLSIGINLLSSYILSRVNLFFAFMVLLFIIASGILFDIIGLSVATADEAPFHSLSARKIPGAKEAISLIRSAQQISNFCNDVIGDISGVISGVSSAMIAISIAAFVGSKYETPISLILTGLAAALTVGGKAIGKGISLTYDNSIMFLLGKICFYVKFPFKNLFKRRTI